MTIGEKLVEFGRRLVSLVTIIKSQAASGNLRFESGLVRFGSEGFYHKDAVYEI